MVDTLTVDNAADAKDSVFADYLVRFVGHHQYITITRKFTSFSNFIAFGSAKSHWVTMRTQL